ncbi:MAG: glycosyltransferase [Bacteroidia bacterium]|jgi:glycosyltransferase involved in cell wall biosynthesis|nr:glycosyltransferase [Bacteroidia bacterium]
MATEQLVIAYAGSLAYFDPAQQAPKGLLSRLFGTYQVDNLDISTRSAYYLFAGLQQLIANHPEYATRIKLHFWGAIDKRTAAQAAKMGVQPCVQIESYKAKADSLRTLQQADVLFLPLETEKNGQRPLFIPGKLYEYLATGKPVLAVAGSSDCTDILRKAGTGIIVNPFDSAAIAAALKELCDNKARLGEIYRVNEEVVKEYSFDVIAGKMVGVFETVLKNK